MGKQVFVRGMPHMQWEDFQVISGSAERIAAQAHPVAVGDRIAAKIEHVHASNPSSGIARVDGFVIDCHHGAQYVGKMVTLEIVDVLRPMHLHMHKSLTGPRRDARISDASFGAH